MKINNQAIARAVEEFQIEMQNKNKAKIQFKRTGRIHHAIGADKKAFALLEFKISAHGKKSSEVMLYVENDGWFSHGCMC